MDCFLCRKNEDILIKRYRLWSLLIHRNQHYLGRSILSLNRHIVDLFDTTKEEREELFSIMKDVREVFKKLFSPDLFNYASLGNNVEHLHLHIIPRYKKKRVFQGFEFFDENWGRNYKPYDVDACPNKEIVDAIKEEIESIL